MRQCKNCGKEIPKDKKFCNEECVREYYGKEKKGQNNFNSVFWVKGEGMSRRYHNIEIMKDLINSGLSYQQIVRISRKYFTSKIIDEYYDIALDEIKNPIEINEESFMGYAKRKTKEGKK